MIEYSKRIIKKVFNQIGLDIIRISKSGKHSLLGLRGLNIRTIVDVGANTGQFARYISTFFPEAHVYCFEPLPDPYKELHDWAVRQKSDRVTAVNLALGDQEGTLEMFWHVGHSPSSSFLHATDVCKTLYPATQKQVLTQVNLTTLDKWLKGLHTPPAPDILIKLDVQGYEHKVILGGQETFSVAQACILEVSLDHLYDDQATFEDISSLLYDLGYRYIGNLSQHYAKDGHVIYVDAVFVKDSVNSISW